MKLFIQVKDGNPINHPAFEENLIDAFGKIPDDWEPFNRIPRPVIGTYEVFESENPTYEKVNGVWADVWHFREMTLEEKNKRDEELEAIRIMLESNQEKRD